MEIQKKSKLKKVICIVLRVFQVILLVAAFAIYYFGENKMGMARFLIFANGEIKQMMPINYILRFLGSIFISIPIPILLNYRFMKKKKIAKTYDVVIYFVFAVIFMSLSFGFGESDFVSYYFVEAVLLVFLVCQGIRVWIENSKK
ncbi:MAG: hypothetical protein LBM02_04045 [Lachnospiraceae bacterium]|nr:hypothetical protein [Lachnospiraceae bacterium]